MAQTSYLKISSRCSGFPKKYNLTCNAIKLDSKIKKELPAWYDIGAKKLIKDMNISISGKCLREKHLAATMGDLHKIKKCLRTSTNPDHIASKTCTCVYCELDRRTRHCDNPNRCANAAAKIIKKHGKEVENKLKTAQRWTVTDRE